MTMLTVSALVCAMMAVTGAAVLPGGVSEKEPIAERHLVKRSLSCSAGWTLLHGRCFRFNPRPMTWAQAEKSCEQMGGNLASVHNDLEYHDVQGLILRATHEHKATWIGGSDAQEEKQWFWSDGTPFHYVHWCPGEPNNHNGRQSCLHMNHGGQKCWDDLQCSGRYPSVCAKKI